MRFSDLKVDDLFVYDYYAQGEPNPVRFIAVAVNVYTDDTIVFNDIFNIKESRFSYYSDITASTLDGDRLTEEAFIVIERVHHLSLEGRRLLFDVDDETLFEKYLLDKLPQYFI